VLFDEGSAQAYFDDGHGEEWEMELGHQSYALVQALRTVSGI
jgi:hypothetical protein